MAHHEPLAARTAVGLPSPIASRQVPGPAPALGGGTNAVSHATASPHNQSASAARSLPRWFIASFAALSIVALAAAQTPTPSRTDIGPATHARNLPMDQGAAAVWQSLKKLHTRASLLLIVAHPDDEDSGMLTYESRGLGTRTAMLTLNRGEGGQNLMSDDFYDALGLVRTQELLAADRYIGVAQYFSSVVDFGFSKTQQGTLDKWGYNRVLADVVRVVRETRPLVIASVFVGNVSDGHGNHIVAGETAQAAFVAAADPHMFPDQIAAGLRPWQALRVYARVPGNATGPFHDYVDNTDIPGPLSADVEIPEGGYDPMLGASYIQIAREGLNEQRTQNGGIGIPDLGPTRVAYHLFGFRGPAPSTADAGYFGGIDVSLPGLADLAGSDQAPFLRPGLEAINQIVEHAMSAFSGPQPQAIAPLLAQGLTATEALLRQVGASSLDADAKANLIYELDIKRAQFNDALAEALGVEMAANVIPEGGGGLSGRGGAAPTFQDAIPGQTFRVQVHVASPNTPVTIEQVRLAGPPGENWTIAAGAAPAGRGGRRGGADAASVPDGAAQAPAALGADQARDYIFAVTVPANARPTQPYYSRPNKAQAYYDIDDPRYATLPETPYPLSAWVTVGYQDASFQLAEDVQTVEKVTGEGNVLNPLVVAPAISVSIAPHAGIVPLDAHTLRLTVTVHSNVKGPATGVAKLRLPSGWSSQPAVAPWSFSHDGEEQPIQFLITPAAVAQRPYTITASADYNGASYESGYHTAGYPGIRPYNLYSPAVYETRGVDVTVAPGLNVGYVTGTGDNVPDSLANLGVQVHFLTAEDLATGDLSRFNTIVLGIRAYAARPELKTYNSRLLDYVKGGGVLIVQYNTTEYDHDYGPYPYSLSNERVMDEKSAVQLLAPDNPVLSWPNKITAADFTGWFEERGHNFMGTWDPHYHALVEMHDPNQAPQSGGLLYCPYGKGVYIYAGLALYRQLPEGVPGAYRIFANLLSVGKAPRP